MIENEKPTRNISLNRLIFYNIHDAILRIDAYSDCPTGFSLNLTNPWSSIGDLQRSMDSMVIASQNRPLVNLGYLHWSNYLFPDDDGFCCVFYHK